MSETCEYNLLQKLGCKANLFDDYARQGDLTDGPDSASASKGSKPFRAHRPVFSPASVKRNRKLTVAHSVHFLLYSIISIFSLVYNWKVGPLHFCTPSREVKQYLKVVFDLGGSNGSSVHVRSPSQVLTKWVGSACCDLLSTVMIWSLSFQPLSSWFPDKP